MDNGNALITKAMLALYLDEKHIDYLNMLEPFILHTLPRKIGQVINIDETVRSVSDESGIKVTGKVIEKILMRLAHDSRNNMIKMLNSNHTFNYIVNKPINTSDFERKKKEMKNLVSDVVCKLKNFLNDEAIIKKYTDDEAQKALIDFLNKYNYESYSNTDNIEKIQNNENILSDNYRVAKFIISEHQQTCGCFEKIRQIQEGYFASVALYFFTTDEKFANKKLLKDTRVILDTMLLVDSLKLNTEYKAKSMEDLLTLIEKDGGELYTYTYYVKELQGIIKKYIEDSSLRLILDLDYFRRKKMSLTEIVLYMHNLETSVKNNSIITLPNKQIIKVIDEPDYSDMVEEKNWHINVEQLEAAMLNNIKYQYKKEDTAFKYDYKTLEAIPFSNIHDHKKTIFVTSNRKLVKTAIQFYYDIKETLFFTDIDLTAYLWLSNYNPKSKLPELALLENAYAALSPTKEIVSSVLKIIDNNIECDNEQIRNDAILLRNNDNLLSYISEVTKNDKTQVTETIQNDLMNCLKKDITRDIKQEVVNELSIENQEYKRDLENQKKLLATQEYKMEQKSSKLEKKEFTLSVREEQLLKTEYEHEEAKTKLLNTQAELNKIQIYSKQKITKYANIFSKIATTFCSLFVFSVVCFASFIICYYTIKHISNDDLISNYNLYISLILAFATLIPLFFSIRKLIKKTVNKIFDLTYNYLYRHSKILNSDKI